MPLSRGPDSLTAEARCRCFLVDGGGPPATSPIPRHSAAFDALLSCGKPADSAMPEYCGLIFYGESAFYEAFHQDCALMSPAPPRIESFPATCALGSVAIYGPSRGTALRSTPFCPAESRPIRPDSNVGAPYLNQPQETCAAASLANRIVAKVLHHMLTILLILLSSVIHKDAS